MGCKSPEGAPRYLLCLIMSTLSNLETYLLEGFSITENENVQSISKCSEFSLV